MKTTIRRASFALLAALCHAASAGEGASAFVSKWPVLGSCAGNPTAPTQVPTAAVTLACDGAFAVELNESAYRQITRIDLRDTAAFNADGQALPFGPMPAVFTAPPQTWQQSPWFALPAPALHSPDDLHLHVTRSPAGDLSLDASMGQATRQGVTDFLVDVRAKNRQVDALELTTAADAADFSAQVSVQASDDLQQWRDVVDTATVAQLRQGGQMLARRRVEFPPQQATYLRVHVRDGAIPLQSVQLLLHPLVPASENIVRSRMVPELQGSHGRVYEFALPARVPVERVDVHLTDDNVIASFAISAREPGQRDWTFVGQVNAFRLRGAGVSLDSQAVDVPVTRLRQWRVQSSVDLQRAPQLELSYRPERWLLLTHGRAPYFVAAGSTTAVRPEFPLAVLVDQVRNKFGRGWTPALATLGPMQTAGGNAALSAYDPESRRTWLLWGVLVLAAGAIIAMVLHLLRAPPQS